MRDIDIDQEYFDKFEKSFIDHALREKKEFFATELIFRSLFSIHRIMLRVIYEDFHRFI